MKGRHLLVALGAGLGIGAALAATPIIIDDRRDLPVRASLSGSFSCRLHSVELAVQQSNGRVQILRFRVDGRLASGNTRATLEAAMLGFTAVRGMSASCSPSNSNVTLILTGRAATLEARRRNKLGDDEYNPGKAIHFSAGNIVGINEFPAVE